MNELLDALNAGGDGIDCYAASRGDARLAAAALAAYTRQLPEPLIPEQNLVGLAAALDIDDFAHRVAGVRDTIAELPEANQARTIERTQFLLR